MRWLALQPDLEGQEVLQEPGGHSGHVPRLGAGRGPEPHESDRRVELPDEAAAGRGGERDGAAGGQPDAGPPAKTKQNKTPPPLARLLPRTWLKRASAAGAQLSFGALEHARVCVL